MKRSITLLIIVASLHQPLSAAEENGLSPQIYQTFPNDMLVRLAFGDPIYGPLGDEKAKEELRHRPDLAESLIAQLEEVKQSNVGELGCQGHLRAIAQFTKPTPEQWARVDALIKDAYAHATADPATRSPSSFDEVVFSQAPFALADYRNPEGEAILLHILRRGEAGGINFELLEKISSQPTPQRLAALREGLRRLEAENPNYVTYQDPRWQTLCAAVKRAETILQKESGPQMPSPAERAQTAPPRNRVKGATASDPGISFWSMSWVWIAGASLAAAVVLFVRKARN